MMKKFALLFLSLLICATSAQNCPAYTFTDNNRYAACNALPVLNSFLHWNYYQQNNTVDIAYRHTGISPSNWIAWSINPSGGRMLGSQCLVALFNSTTNAPRVYTSPITGYAPRMQQEAPLSFSVPSMRAEFINDSMIIYATIMLPTGRTSFQQVWQHGDVSHFGVPLPHPMTQDHLTSFSTIDFSTGTFVNTGATAGGSRQLMKNAHGVLNVVSWGIMMPLGAMAARYVKVFNLSDAALWFYMHVICQAFAYFLGIAGWATGIVLGRRSLGVEHTLHRNIGITLLVLGTLQAFAVKLRPKPDNKYRKYWNYYHHSIGYTVIAVSVFNIFKGLDILDPGKKWKRAYLGMVIFMVAVVACLEACKWLVLKKRENETSKQPNTGSTTLRIPIRGYFLR